MKQRMEVPLLVLALALGGCDEKPATYEDCILEHLGGGARSDSEIALLKSACASRFPRRQATELPPGELAKVEVSVDRVSGNTLNVWIYNPTDWTLAELRFVVHVAGNEASERTYRERFRVPPESAGYVSIQVYRPLRSGFVGAEEDLLSSVTLASAAGWPE